VLDALDTGDPFDANIELNYLGHAKVAKITREDVRDGRNVDVVEFLYAEHSHQVMPKLRVGIFQDVELFISLPYTIWEQRAGWAHPRAGGGAKSPRENGYSTFARDMCLYGSQDPQALPKRPKNCERDWGTSHRDTLSGNEGSWPVNHEYEVENGRPKAGSWTGSDTDWAMDPDNTDPYAPRFHSIRGAVAYSVKDGFYFFPQGIGDLKLGFAFSPFSFARFNDTRDSAMPTMRVEAAYQVPSGPVDTPYPSRKRRAELGGDWDDFSPGGTGSGLHRLSTGLAMSKQVLFLDPYFGAQYTLGIPQGYPRDAPERAWTDFGFWQNRALAYGGVEFIPLHFVEEVRDIINLRIILGARGEYVARHRGPSEMSDALHKWTLVDNYAAVSGQLGILFSVPFVSMKANLEVGHETPHLLTGEQVGTDNNGDGVLSKSERNPFYNPLLDTPGRRVKVSESNFVNGMVQVALSF
jgi:hypothetical protein